MRDASAQVFFLSTGSVEVPAANVDRVGEVQSGCVGETRDGVGRVGVEEEKFGGVIGGEVVLFRIVIGRVRMWCCKMCYRCGQVEVAAVYPVVVVPCDRGALRRVSKVRHPCST